MCKDCGCDSLNQGEWKIDNNPKLPVYTNEELKQTIHIHESILSKSNHLAQHNRDYFKLKNLFVLNILSSPGSGKTTFIQRTLKDLNNYLLCGVIVGDLATDNDAQRLRSSGAPVIQITTGNTCHLEAEMIGQAIKKLDVDKLNLLIIENVGNLVCPAAYDLGENLRVVLLSVTEGEDKPLKYPVMFKSADIVIINKFDLVEFVEFDRDTTINNIQKIAPTAYIFELSARTGLGMDDWCSYLKNILTSTNTVKVYQKYTDFELVNDGREI